MQAYRRVFFVKKASMEMKMHLRHSSNHPAVKWAPLCIILKSFLYHLKLIVHPLTFSMCIYDDIIIRAVMSQSKVHKIVFLTHNRKIEVCRLSLYRRGPDGNCHRGILIFFSLLACRFMHHRIYKYIPFLQHFLVSTQTNKKKEWMRYYIDTTYFHLVLTIHVNTYTYVQV